MTFDDDARIDSSKVTRRRGGRGRTTGIAAGGGGLLVVVAVILGSLIPWFALSSSRTMVTPMQSESEILAEPAPVDPDRVRRGIDLAHDLVLGLSLSVTLIVILGAPWVVHLGWAGLGIVWAAGLVQIDASEAVEIGG